MAEKALRGMTQEEVQEFFEVMERRYTDPGGDVNMNGLRHWLTARGILELDPDVRLGRGYGEL